MSLTSHSFEPGLLLNVPEARTSGKTISCLAFSPTGNIICAGFGNVLRFWDMAQPGFHILDYISWQDMNVTCIAWDNDGLHCGFNNGGYCTIVFDEDTWVSEILIKHGFYSTYIRALMSQGVGWELPH